MKKKSERRERGCCCWLQRRCRPHTDQQTANYLPDSKLLQNIAHVAHCHSHCYCCCCHHPLCLCLWPCLCPHACSQSPRPRPHPSEIPLQCPPGHPGHCPDSSPAGVSTDTRLAPPPPPPRPSPQRRKASGRPQSGRGRGRRDCRRHNSHRNRLDCRLIWCTGI